MYTEEAGDSEREIFCLLVAEKWSDLEQGEWKVIMKKNQQVVQYSMCGKLSSLSTEWQVLNAWWLPDEMELVPQLCKWINIFEYQGKEVGQPFKKWEISSLFGGTEGGTCKRQTNKPSSGKEPWGFSVCENEGGFCGLPNNELLNTPCRPLKDGK